jgi:hypothetical protein
LLLLIDLLPLAGLKVDERCVVVVFVVFLLLHSSKKRLRRRGLPSNHQISTFNCSVDQLFLLVHIVRWRRSRRLSQIAASHVEWEEGGRRKKSGENK